MEPYGISITKRLVVMDAEEELYNQKEVETSKSHFVELIDYMGGDAMVERVATAGHGVKIFPERPEREDFLKHLVAKGIMTPFKSVQLKFRIQCSIKDALHIVYDPKASVNEYSGRYSVMINTAFIPSIEYIKSRMEGLSESEAQKKAEEAHKLFVESRDANYERYKHLVEDLDLARELSRTPLEINNDTTFVWKMDLLSLIQFVKEKRKLFSGRQSTLKGFLDQFEYFAKKVAPLSLQALNNGQELKLTYPNDDKIIDPTPLPADWEPKETKRVCVPELEEVMFKRQNYLSHGGVQVADYMGDDRGPVESARISYGTGTKRMLEDRKLLRYLLRHKHTTPFECIELSIEGKTPAFVDPRQARRHRTLDTESFMGEVLVGSDYFMPAREELKHQDRKNRQGRGMSIDDGYKEEILDVLKASYKTQTELVEKLRKLGMDEELIRGVKGVGFYTYIWRTGDMHNWLHFLALRYSPHAQKEIYQFAAIIAEFVKRHSPSSYQALMDYRINAISFTGIDKKMIAALLPRIDFEDVSLYEPLGYTVEKDGVKKLNREGVELQKKLLELQEMNTEEVEEIRKLKETLE